MKHDLFAVVQLAADIRQRKLISEGYTVVILFLNKGQRQNACVDQVGHVNTGKGLDDHRLDAKIEWGESRMFA